MSEPSKTGAPSLKQSAVSLSPVAILSALAGISFGGFGALIVALGLLGTPLFAIMGGASELAWLLHKDPSYRFLRFIAPNVLDDRFAGSPVLVTIPLFTYVGYLLAESRTADRIIRFSSAVLGWLPGHVAVVCIFASAFFTAITGGSGATIIAVGGLLYPALRKQGYSEAFSLGLITTGGSLGLFFPPSLPVLVYSLVAGIDFTKAYKVGVIPGLMAMVFLIAYSVFVSARQKGWGELRKLAGVGPLMVNLAMLPAMALGANVGREETRKDREEIAAALWEVKWELFIPVIIMGGLLTGVTGLDESAGLAAIYTLLVEIYLYKDLRWKDLPRLTKSAVGLAGALILILAMANALINYVIQEQIPGKVLEFMLQLGLTKTWQFLLVMNAFLLVLGMLMEGFSAILVAVPLILPFAAEFKLNPFHLAMIFILNLEIAYVCPPLGLNLFIASFRFNRPVVTLYRTVLPFLGLLSVALVIVSYVPRLSIFPIDSDIRAARAESAKVGLPPREAWVLECVQADRSNVKPCTPEDEKKWGEKAQAAEAEKTPVVVDAGPPATGTTDDDIVKMMRGDDTSAADAGTGAAPTGSPTDDDIMKMMRGDDKPAAAPDAGQAPAPPSTGSPTDDDIKKMMLQ